MLVLSSVSVGDPAPRQVVGRQLDLDPIAGQDPDVVLAHFSGDSGENAVAAVDLHAEHRAWKRFDDFALDLDFLFLLRHSPHRNRARRARCRIQKTTAQQRLRRVENGSKTVPACPAWEAFDYGNQPAWPAAGASRSTLALRSVRIRGPLSVIATVCSKWADSEPSA